MSEATLEFDPIYLLRRLAMLELAIYLPGDYTFPNPSGAIGADPYRRITTDRWAWPSSSPSKVGYPGTTCGFTVSWMLWALGCRDRLRVNHTDAGWNTAHPQQVMGYLSSYGINRLHKPWIAKEKTTWGKPNGYFSATDATERKAALEMQVANLKKTLQGKLSSSTRARYESELSAATAELGTLTVDMDAFAQAWIPWDAKQPERRPQTGDVVVIQTPGSKPDDAHTFVFMEAYEDGTRWLTADGGQPSVAAGAGSVTFKDGVSYKPGAFMTFNYRAIQVSSAGALQVGSPPGLGDKYKSVLGWVDLAKIPWRLWRWASSPSTLPVPDPAVIDLAPRDWTYPSAPYGVAQQDARMMAMGFAAQCGWEIVWRWYSQCLNGAAPFASIESLLWSVQDWLDRQSDAVQGSSQRIGATSPDAITLRVQGLQEFTRTLSSHLATRMVSDEGAPLEILPAVIDLMPDASSRDDVA